MTDLQSIKDKILLALLPEVQNSGWSWDGAKRAACQAGFQDTMCDAVFPEGLSDVVAHFSDYADRQMLEKLEMIDSSSMRVRDRIGVAILERLTLLEKMGAEAAMKATLSYWAFPTRVLQGQRVLWRSADRIWTWAGDVSTDYNRYTKRGLLTSLIMGTTMVWLDDKTENKEASKAFLDRRLENIMEIGRTIGTIKASKPDFAKRSWTKRT